MEEATINKRTSRRAQLEGIGAFLLALGCARAWLTLLFAVPALPTSSAVNAHNVFDMVYSLLAVVVAVSASRMTARFAPLSEKTWSKVIVCVGMFGASVLSCCCGLFQTPPAWLTLSAAVLGGLGFCAFLLSWSELMSCLSLARIALFSASSQVFAAILVYFCTGLSQDRLEIALLLLPLVALWALSHIRQHVAAPADVHPRVEVSKAMPWKLIVLMGVFSFAYGLRSAHFALGSGMHSGLSTGIAMTLFAAAVYFFSDRISLKALSRTAPLLLLCGFLLIPAEGLLGTVVSSYMISIGYSVMSLLVSLMLYDISKRFGIAIVALVGWKYAMQLFVVLGSQVDVALDALGVSAGMQDAAVTGVVVLLMFLCVFILLSEKDIGNTWGVRFMDAESLTEDGLKRKQLIERCDQISRDCKLSPREDEILRLYAQGKNGPAIEKELFIAQGTLKTHTRHIYEKAGVTSRKELLALLGVE